LIGQRWKHGDMWSLLVLISHRDFILFDIYNYVKLKRIEKGSYILKMVVLIPCGETPVLISNTEVKATGGDGTAGLYRWESSLVPPS
jgi:hypothetical protein